MKTALITGANKGIGLQTAKELIKEGYYVFIGSRDQERGRMAAATLQAEGLHHFEIISIDVTNTASIEMARSLVIQKTDHLDVLINNAGIAGTFPQSALDLSIEQFEEVLNTNLYGVVRTIKAFKILLEASASPRIINISSSIGSLTLHTDPNWTYYNDANQFAVYSTSKTALNMYSVVLAYELRHSQVKVHMVDPGYIKTDFNNHQGLGTVEEAANRVLNVLNNSSLESGKFISEEYNEALAECPW